MPPGSEAQFRPENVSVEVDDPRWTLTLAVKHLLMCSERCLESRATKPNLSVKNEPTLLINPDVVLSKRAVLLSDEAIGEADDASHRREQRMIKPAKRLRPYGNSRAN